MRFALLSKTNSRRCAGPSARSTQICSGKSSPGAKHRDRKASGTGWIVACSCASGPAVNADCAALTRVSAEGRAVSRISRATSKNCVPKPFSNSRVHASGKSQRFAPGKSSGATFRRSRRSSVKWRVSQWSGFFQELLRKLAGEVPKSLRERKISFLCCCCSYDWSG